ncbi:MAG TPA: NAD(P)/FAD-dependent oxidoreductase [Brevundimonas sp.]|jgi:thioredoxin reductase (NADPH)|uniref:NAD(P)/FAD-dependent oxidoreductase n=1 Tax=Brevundimonas sp. TaxID=1871086 RepID=UPI002DE2DEA7|nr:NAD(P)/FAD-dependent oxidoreductase [Brevundimonas sp.]
MNDVDVLVVGAGPAGLTAAAYLARFRRSVIVADGGKPRACWIPVSHNMPGFPEGITGEDILKRMTSQAQEYGAVVETGRVQRLERDGTDFAARLNERTVRARAVILATGVSDRKPPIPGVDDAIERSLVRICPICDGFEATGKSVAIIGDDDMGLREAAFLRTYSDRVTLIHVGDGPAPSADEAARLGVEVLVGSVEAVRLEGDHARCLTWGGADRIFDHVYSALGTTPAVDLAVRLGAAVGADDGRLVVDDHQATSVPGLWAVGDVVRGLNQIAVATAEAAVAATAVHNELRRVEGMVVRD